MILICGPSGIGKSTFIKNLNYKEKNLLYYLWDKNVDLGKISYDTVIHIDLTCFYWDMAKQKKYQKKLLNLLNIAKIYILYACQSTILIRKYKRYRQIYKNKRYNKYHEKSYIKKIYSYFINMIPKENYKNIKLINVNMIPKENYKNIKLINNFKNLSFEEKYRNIYKNKIEVFNLEKLMSFVEQYNINDDDEIQKLIKKDLQY